MTNDELSEGLPPELVELMRSASAPPEPAPREEMWAAIEARMSPRPAASAPPLYTGWASRRGAHLGLAACVILIAGIALGRMMGSPGNLTSPGLQPLPGPGQGTVAAGAVRTAALGHLSSSETLLSFVGSEVAQGELDPELTSRGRTLLRDTRMLLDVLPRDEVPLRTLLEDLELLLSQVVILHDGEMDPARRGEEMRLLSDGMRSGGVLSRIQAALPLMESGQRNAGRRLED